MQRYLVLVFLVNILLNAASFDCKKASTKIEKEICSDSNLSSLDSQLGDTYKKLKDTITNNQIKNFFTKTQKKWLKNRNKSCKKYDGDELKSCLTDHYTQRIEKLKVFADDGSFIYRSYQNIRYLYTHVPSLQNAFKKVLDKEQYKKFLQEYKKWEDSYNVCLDKYGVMQETCVVAIAKKKTTYYKNLLEDYKNVKYLVEDGKVVVVKRRKKSFLNSYNEEKSEICYSYKYYPQSEYKKLFHKDINTTKIIPPMEFEQNKESKNSKTCKADNYRFRVQKTDKIIFIAKHIVVFQRDEFSYFGGAHGNYETIYYAFDRDSAKPINMKEIRLKNGDSCEAMMKKVLSKEKYEYYFGSSDSVKLRS